MYSMSADHSSEIMSRHTRDIQEWLHYDSPSYLAESDVSDFKLAAVTYDHVVQCLLPWPDAVYSCILCSAVHVSC